MTSTKRCTVCQVEKPATPEHFVRQARKKDGLHGTCKDCLASKQRQARKAAGETYKSYAREWQRQLRSKDPDPKGTARKRKDRKLKQFFGIDLDQYEALYREQGGCCAICGAIPSPGRSLHTDHDHVTGAIRGLLCGRCNLALGGFGDSTELLHRAMTYLERSLCASNVVLLRKPT